MESFKSTEEAGVKELLDIEKVNEEIDEKRIKLESFRGHKHFSEQEIDKDIKTCDVLKHKFENRRNSQNEERREQSERGLAAEFAFRNVMENYGWLAEKVKMIVTSQYDDFVRGIDSVAQIEIDPKHSEHLGFAIDFATGTNDIGEKLRRTFDDIDLGYTPAVKYFESEKTGQVKNFKLPRIVVGAGHESLERLVSYSFEIMNGSAITESVRNEIKEDPFRFVLFGEIQAQLSVFINRLEKVIVEANKQNKQEIMERATTSLEVHKNTLAVIQKLAEEAGADIKTIQQHIRGDAFAMQMSKDLSLLSFTPIDLDRKP
ncbi:MAG: hypothetical protein WCS89_00495 [Candidatus Paceibacterota bacterium]|jgi:hypothetical protein